MKINLVAIHIEKSPLSIPLGAGMIKAALDSDRFISRHAETSLFEYYPENTAGEIAAAILKSGAAMTGFSVYLWNRECILECAALVKKMNPAMVLFAGGAEASADPVGLIADGVFDFVIKGEGELIAVEAVKSFIREESYSDIPGVYTPGGKHPSLPLPPDPSRLPSPYLMHVINSAEKKSVLWELSRGCPFRCGFCFESRNTAGVRFFNRGRLKKELKHFVMSGVVQIFVLDPTFNYDKNRAKYLLKYIAKKTPHIHFTFEVRAEFIDEEMAVLFSKNNCSLQIGLQSSAPEVLNAINRRMNHDIYRRNIGFLNKYNIVFGLDLIYGLPLDTIKTFRESLNFALSLSPNHLDIFPLAVLAGTDVRDRADEFQLNYVKKPPYTVISTPQMSLSAMDEGKMLQEAVGLFYNSGSVAWFKHAVDVSCMDFSTYLERLYEYYKRSVLAPLDAHLSFLHELLGKLDKIRLFLPIKNLILFHSGINSLQLCECASNEKPLVYNRDSVLVVAESVRLLTLEYTPDSLLEIGSTAAENCSGEDMFIPLSIFPEVYTAGNYHVVLYKHFHEVKWLTVEACYFKVLAEFGERKKVSSINMDEILESELEEFVRYCLAEGILVE